MSQENTSRKKSSIAVGVVVFIIIVVAAAGFTFLTLIKQPEIQVATWHSDGYWSGLTYRANVTATLSNYGDVDGYATVKFSLIWGGQTQQYQTRVARVAAHSNTDVFANLTASASALETVTSQVQVIEQHKA